MGCFHHGPRGLASGLRQSPCAGWLRLQDRIVAGHGNPIVRLPQRSCRISPATKWYEFNPALQTSAPIPQATIRELQRAKPKLIVLERNWTTFDEPNNIAISSGVTLLDDYPSAEAAAAGGTMGPTTPGRCGGLTRPLPEQGIARANDLLGMPAWNAR